MPVSRNPIAALVVAFAALALALCSHSLVAANVDEPVELTILHTNDVHGHLFPFNYNDMGTVANDVGGVARRATLIRRIREAANHPVLVMDAGDVFTRGPVSDLMGVPDFEVMNAVPYDIMTIGNNEFKGAPGMAGQRNLRERVKQAKFAIISANVTETATGQNLVPPWKVFEAKGVRVGVFGLTAPRAASYSQADGLHIADPVQTAKAIVPRLLNECDLIVALTHIGYPLDLRLAAAVPEIDVIIGGDSHTWLPKPSLVTSGAKTPDWWVGGTIVCQDGEWGKCLGRLDVVIRRSGERRWRVASYSAELMPVDSSTPPADDIERILSDYTKLYTREIGTMDKALPLDRAAAWVADIMRNAAATQVAVVPTYTVENGLNAGAVTELDIRKMLPFRNKIARVSLTGSRLLAFVREMDCALAGIELRGDYYYVEGRPLDKDASYSLAVEDYFVDTSASLSGLSREVLCPTSDAVKSHVSRIQVTCPPMLGFGPDREG